MCGFAGIVFKGGARRAPAEITAELGRMSAAIAARGPDETTTRTSADGAVAIVFNRLAIVDVEGGRQPVSAGRVWGVVNGEIYNHLDLRRELSPPGGFASRSDAEVVPHAYARWGLDFPTRFNGMFASAVVDEDARRVVLARDPLGIKPLFVHEAADAFYFASEIKALLAHPAVPRRYDWPAAMRAIGTPRGDALHPSFFEGIDVVAPGSIRVLEPHAGRERVQAYWRRDPRGRRAATPPRAPSDIARSLRDLLEDAVRSQLMGDVEVGLFLSGGIDSVAIAALAARHAPALHCFSVAHESTVGSGDLASAARVADGLGLPLHPIAFPDAFDVRADDWASVLWGCELHLAGVEHFFKHHLHAAAKRVRPGLRVVLIGQGSDEFTGGYTRYAHGASWAEVARSLQLADLREYGEALGLAEAGRALGPLWLGDRPDARAVRDEPIGDRYWRTYTRNLDYHLWLEDRVSSANSVEARVPFLDQRVVELLLGMPVGAHEPLLFDKAVLRVALADLLPEDIRMRPKGPFFYGRSQGSAMRLVHRLIRADRDALVDGYLGDRAEARHWIDVDAFRALLARDDPDAPGSRAQSLLAVLSMGMLAGMAEDLAPGVSPCFAASEIPRDALVARVADALRRDALEPEDAVALRPGASLLQRAGVSDGGLTIAVGSAIELVVADVRVAAVLGRLDGTRTLAQAAALAGQPFESVRAALEAMLARGLIVRVPREGASP